jgi:hypothetical protein
MTNLHKKLLNPYFFGMYMIAKLPMAFLAGLRIRTLTHDQSVVTITQSYWNKNPFGSIYFACLAMAAEMSTGLPALLAAYAYKPPVAMLVVGMQAEFYKKSVGKITFECIDAAAIYAAVQQAQATDQSVQHTATALGTNADGVQVAKFLITWSFKKRS